MQGTEGTAACGIGVEVVGFGLSSSTFRGAGASSVAVVLVI